MARPAATWHISMLTIKMLNVKKQLTSLKIPNFSYNATLYRISMYKHMLFRQHMTIPQESWSRNFGTPCRITEKILVKFLEFCASDANSD